MAIKVATASAETAREARLQTEARILARLEHPGIVPIHSVTHDREGDWTVICMPLLGAATGIDLLDAAFNKPGNSRSAALVARVESLERAVEHAGEAPAVSRGGWLPWYAIVGLIAARAVIDSFNRLSLRGLQPSPCFGDPALLALRKSAKAGDWQSVSDALRMAGRRWEQRDAVLQVVRDSVKTPALADAWLAAELPAEVHVEGEENFELRPGGTLFTFSCSGQISPDLFQKIVAGAALDSGRDVSGATKTETQKLIEEKVGLSFGEFRRAVLLAQGDFASFLRAKPDERAELLEREVRRMLRDPRSSALVENFAGQWLHLRNLSAFVPDRTDFPEFDDLLRQAMRRETELFVGSVIQDDRSALDLLRADYTFMNERLARHYGVKGVYGSDFRRVPVTDPARRGLGAVQGPATMVSISAAALAPLPLAALQQLSGGYTLGLAVMAAIPVACAALATFFDPNRAKRDIEAVRRQVMVERSSQTHG